MYTSYRRDRADDWGRVIKVTKKNLTVEEINIDKECKIGRGQGGNLSEAYEVCILRETSEK